MDAYDTRAHARFESYVDRSGGPNACHLWGGATRNGYGLLWYRGGQVLAHRFAWMKDIGPIPSGKQIRHACDTALCVNLKHLLLGTQLDNMHDRILHGAGYARGESHPRASLTEAQVRRAAELRRLRWSWYAIAAELGVTRSAIARATQHQGGLWRHLDVGPVPAHVITEDLVREAVLLHDQGCSWSEVGRRLGVHRQSIAYALKKRG